MPDVRLATLADIPYIEWLRRHESEAIGFVPKQRYEMEIQGERNGRIYVIAENGDIVGFAYATFGGQSAKVQQIAIQEDARRLERGKALIDHIRIEGEKRQLGSVSCRCAQDLDSNAFWQGIGFSLVGVTDSKSMYGTGREKWSRRGRKLNMWTYAPNGLWVPGTGGEFGVRQKRDAFPRTKANHA